MMLPEHKETIIRRRLEEGRKGRPTLDPQEMELIEGRSPSHFMNTV